MSKIMVRVIPGVLLLLPLLAQADAVSELTAQYLKQGASDFGETAGETFWNKEYKDPKSGKMRSCTSCHSNDLTSTGKHVRTGKKIKPLAPSVNPKRLTDIKKIEKWFKRNCKWTLGRECTPQEKGDVLAFVKSK